MTNQNKETRRIFKPLDILIIVVILVVCLGFYFLLNKKSDIHENIAQITYDGKIVQSISLSNVEDKIFNFKDNSKVSFEIKNHEIRFINTNCPDKLCENVGFISKNNEVAICMPNKITLKVNGQNDNLDAIVN